MTLWKSEPAPRWQALRRLGRGFRRGWLVLIGLPVFCLAAVGLLVWLGAWMLPIFIIGFWLKLAWDVGE